MIEAGVAERADLVSGGRPETLSETFLLLQDEADQRRTDGARLDGLIRKIQSCEQYVASTPLAARKSLDSDDDTDPEPIALVEIKTVFNGEVVAEYLFENLATFRAGFSGERLDVLRETRAHGPIKPEKLGANLGRALDQVLADIRGLAFLGLISENSKGVRVDYDELTVTLKANA